MDSRKKRQAGRATASAASRGSARAQSAMGRMRRNEKRANAAKPAPYGRTEDGAPRLGPQANRARSGQARSVAARKRAVAKKRGK